MSAITLSTNDSFSHYPLQNNSLQEVGEKPNLSSLIENAERSPEQLIEDLHAEAQRQSVVNGAGIESATVDANYETADNILENYVPRAEFSQFTSSDALQFKMLLECFLLLRDMMRDDWKYIRKEAEDELMKAAEECKNSRRQQGWWLLGTAIASGALNIISGVMSGVGSALKWKQNKIDSISKTTSGAGGLVSGIGQALNALIGGSTSLKDAQYEKVKRRLEALNQLLQSNKSTDQGVVGALDQLIRLKTRV